MMTTALSRSSALRSCPCIPAPGTPTRASRESGPCSSQRVGRRQMWSAVAGGGVAGGGEQRAPLDAGHRAQGVGLAIHRSCVFVLVLLLLGCGAVAPAAFAQGSSVPPPPGGCPAPPGNPTPRPAGA